MEREKKGGGTQKNDESKKSKSTGGKEEENQQNKPTHTNMTWNPCFVSKSSFSFRMTSLPFTRNVSEC